MFTAREQQDGWENGLRRWVTVLVVVWMTIAVCLTVITRLHDFPHHSQDPYKFGGIRRSFSIGAALATSFQHFGRFHEPSTEEYVRAIQHSGHMTDYPIVPPDAPEDEFQAEYMIDIGYGVVIGLLWTFFPGNSMWAILVLQLGLDVGGLLVLCWVCYRFAGLLALLICSLLYAFCGPLITLTPSILYYVWPAYGTVLGLGGVVWFSRHQHFSVRQGVLLLGFGLFIGLIIFVRSAAMFIFPVLALALLLTPLASWKQRVMRASIFVVGVLLVLSVLGMRNYQEFGTFMITRGTFWHSVLCGIGLTPDNNSGYQYDDGQVYNQIKEKYGPVDYYSPEYEKLCRKEALAYLTSHPTFYPRRYIELVWDSLWSSRQHFAGTALGPFDLFAYCFPWALVGYGLFLLRNWRMGVVVGLPLLLWLAVTGGVALPLMPPVAPYRVGADVMLVAMVSIGAAVVVDGLARLAASPWLSGRGVIPLLNPVPVSEEDSSPLREERVRSVLTVLHCCLAVGIIGLLLALSGQILDEVKGPTEAYTILGSKPPTQPDSLTLTDDGGRGLAGQTRVLGVGDELDVYVQRGWTVQSFSETHTQRLRYLFYPGYPGWVTRERYAQVTQRTPVVIPFEPPTELAGLRLVLGSNKEFSDGRVRIRGMLVNGQREVLFENPTYAITGRYDIKFPTPYRLKELQIESIGPSTLVRSLQRLVRSEVPAVPSSVLAVSEGVEVLAETQDEQGARIRLRFPRPQTVTVGLKEHVEEEFQIVVLQEFVALEPLGLQADGQRAWRVRLTEGVQQVTRRVPCRTSHVAASGKSREVPILADGLTDAQGKFAYHLLGDGSHFMVEAVEAEEPDRLRLFVYAADRRQVKLRIEVSEDGQVWQASGFDEEAWQADRIEVTLPADMRWIRLTGLASTTAPGLHLYEVECLRSPRLEAVEVVPQPEGTVDYREGIVRFRATAGVNYVLHGRFHSLDPFPDIQLQVPE